MPCSPAKSWLSVSLLQSNVVRQHRDLVGEGEDASWKLFQSGTKCRLIQVFIILKVVSTFLRKSLIHWCHGSMGKLYNPGFSWAESILCHLYFCHSRRFDISFNCWKCQSVTVYLRKWTLRSSDRLHTSSVWVTFVIYVAGCSIWLCASLRPPNEGTQGDLQITELQDRWLHGHVSPQQSASFFSHLNSRWK